MTQMQLPFAPDDKGRRNALQNILLSIQDELRRQAPVAGEIVSFSVEFMPALIANAAIELLSADNQSPVSVSPYDFEVHDLLRDRPANQTVFRSVDQLVEHLDIDAIAAFFENTELIGVDESKVDSPLTHSAATFLKSAAFRSQLEIEPREDAELRYQLIGYIRNNYVAYVSALTSLAFARKPVVVLHGPLVRAIGSFSRIVFDFEEAEKLFNLGEQDTADFQVPPNRQPQYQNDAFSERNMSNVPSETVSGSSNLRQFHRFCIHDCGRKCNSIPALSKSSPTIPDSANKDEPTALQKRRYPGFCLYFWMLRSLFDLVRLSPSVVSSAVEDVSSATEMTRIILPSILTQPAHRTSIASSLKHTLRTLNINITSNINSRQDSFRKARELIKKLKLTDSGLMTHLLIEGQYTSPVQIYRYRSQRIHGELFADNSLGVEDEFEDILGVLFPESPRPIKGLSHPGYRIMMTYVRTTPIREPVRFEYFHLPNKYEHAALIAPMYALSIPYQEYGLPIILYYADKIARTPTDLIRRIIDYEYLDLILSKRYSDPVKIMEILGHLSRGYFQREGLQ
jgi:hypothetical protein